jgi:hypothetical protein
MAARLRFVNRKRVQRLYRKEMLMVRRRVIRQRLHVGPTGAGASTSSPISSPVADAFGVWPSLMTSPTSVSRWPCFGEDIPSRIPSRIVDLVEGRNVSY